MAEEQNKTTIDAGVEAWKNTPGAVLLDVRDDEEYRAGHIPGSVHIPLREIFRAPEVIAEKETPIFVYCLSGGRSAAAVKRLGRLDYTNVQNIGGISDYTGEIER